jgi:hypothetical protein
MVTSAGTIPTRSAWMKKRRAASSVMLASSLLRERDAHCNYVYIDDESVDYHHV